MRKSEEYERKCSNPEVWFFGTKETFFTKFVRTPRKVNSRDVGFDFTGVNLLGKRRPGAPIRPGNGL